MYFLALLPLFLIARVTEIQTYYTSDHYMILSSIAQFMVNFIQNDSQKVLYVVCSVDLE